MDEITALQQQLADVQTTSSKHKLSERNCIQLITKLQQLNLIELIFTRSGKEYLTPSQLTLEISDQVLSCGGRVNLIDLPDALDVELFHIEKALPQVLDPPAIRLVRGEILTDYYLSSVAEEINDSLSSSEHGTEDVGSIASRYALPVDIVREVVNTHLSTVINATLDSQNHDLLRSDASIARDRAAAIGLLSATSIPTPLSDLANLKPIPITFVADLAKQMLQEGKLNGALSGRGTSTVFVPQVYSKAAEEVASNTFAVNGFITLERISKMHIPDSSSFIDNHLQGAIVLNQCAVSPTVIDTLATSASEVIMGEHWLDVEAALPPDFPAQDVSEVVVRLLPSPAEDKTTSKTKSSGRSSRSRRKGKNAIPSNDSPQSQTGKLAYGSRFIVSASLKEKFSNALVSHATRKAEERARLMSEKMSTVVTNTTTDVQVDIDQPQDDRSKKTKGKGRRRAKDKSAKNAQSIKSGAKVSEHEEFPILKPSLEEAIEEILSDAANSKAIDADYLGSSAGGDDMIYCLIEDVYGESGIAALYQNKADEAVVTLLRERALAKKNADKSLLADLEAAEIYNRSASSLHDDELVEASKAFVMDNTCINILCRIVDSVSQNNGVGDADVANAYKLGSKKEKLEIVRRALTKLAPSLEAKIRTLLAVLTEKDKGGIDELLNLYDGSISLLDLPERRPVDKKTEKSVFANRRAELTACFEDESLGQRSCLITAATLVHAKSRGGSIIAIPEEFVVGFSKAIEENASPSEMGETLRELRESLNKDERIKSGIGEQPLHPESLEKLQALRNFIG